MRLTQCPRSLSPVANGLAFSLPIALLTVTLGALSTRGQDLTGNDAWIPLFNGKDLQGWTPKIKGHDLGDNYGNTFRVENGILKVAYDKYPKFGNQFGHLFSEHKYSNYRLRIEYRFVGDQCPGGPEWACAIAG